MNTVFPLNLRRRASAFVISESVLPESQRPFAATVEVLAEEELPTTSHNSCIGSTVEEKSLPEACTAVVVPLDCN